MSKTITKLTEEQKAEIPAWVERCIALGLKTGDADRERAERGIEAAYKKVPAEFPGNVTWVDSPFVGSLVASYADAIYRKGVDGPFEPVEKAKRPNDAVMTALKQLFPRNDVEAAVASIPVSDLKWHNWLAGQFWIGGWWGSPAAVSFLTDKCGLILEPDIAERATAYRDICESMNYLWPNRNFVVACERPAAIVRDAEGRLHNENGMAVSYRDGSASMLFAASG